jgi:hypothetical protein
LVIGVSTVRVEPDETSAEAAFTSTQPLDYTPGILLLIAVGVLGKYAQIRWNALARHHHWTVPDIEYVLWAPSRTISPSPSSHPQAYRVESHWFHWHSAPANRNSPELLMFPPTVDPAPDAGIKDLDRGCGRKLNGHLWSSASHTAAQLASKY